MARATKLGPRLWFDCPGCGFPHGIEVEPCADRTPWEWNGSVDLPTLSPSILARTPRPDGDLVCHSFVRDGRIEFCTDSTHALAGKTVDLPER